MPKAPRRGLTLVELLVALAILGLLGSVAVRFLARMFDLTTQAGVRGTLQTSGLVALQAVSQDLQRTRADLIAQAELPDGGTVTGFPRLLRASGQGRLVWETFATVYQHSRPTRTLLRRRWPPRPPALAVSFESGRPARMEADHLLQICLPPGNGTERVLCAGVERFSVTLRDGGPAVVVQLELSLQGRQRETASLSSTLVLRN